MQKTGLANFFSFLVWSGLEKGITCGCKRYGALKNHFPVHLAIFTMVTTKRKNAKKKRREETQISIFHPKSALEVFCVRRGRSNSRPGFAFHRPSSQHHHHHEEMMERGGWERGKEEYHTIKMCMVEYICLKSRWAAEDLIGKTRF